MILLVVLVLFYLRKKLFKTAFLIDTYFVLILPVIFLSYNHLNDGGERYNYLPSVAFVILLSFIVWQVKQKYLKKLIIAALIIYFAVFLINKNYNWHLAGQISEQVIRNDFAEVVDFENDKELIFVSLPDTLSGAQVLRNGIIPAINLYYPDYSGDMIRLGAYTRLTRQNMNEKVLYWGAYPTGGYIAETYDKRNWVTGFDRQETDKYIFELWNYDYPTYTSNTIRLILKDNQGQFIPAGEESQNILIFNQGVLKSLNK